MATTLKQINQTLLMGPGPSTVPPEVYEALSTYTVGHLDPAFIAVMDDIKVQLRKVMKTQNEITVPMSGTGSAGMETVLVNLIEPGDSVLVLINGVFGGRMKEIAIRLEADVHVREYEWGTPVDLEDVRSALQERPYKLVAVVHAETSTGVANPVEEIGKLVHETGSLFVVDAVTSLGGMPVLVDQWGIDAIYSGTQKCLACPPGLAPVSMSDRALEAIRARKTPVKSWYLDLSLIMNYWSGNTRAYHHTAPINMNYGLNAALDLVISEGLEAVWKRHQDAHKYLVQRLTDLGFKMLVDPEYRLPMLNAVLLPEGLDEKEIRMKLLTDHHIEVGGGLGKFAGKLWRVGLMGYTAKRESVDRLADALNKLL